MKSRDIVVSFIKKRLLLLLSASGITSKQLPVAPKNRDTLPQPTKSSYTRKPEDDWRDVGNSYVVGKSERERDSYNYDDSSGRKKGINLDEIKKQGMYEVPEKFDDDDDDDPHHEKVHNEKNKEELSKQALKQHLYEVPEDEKNGEESGKKMKEEDGIRRDGGMSSGELSTLADEGGKDHQETAESYEDSEVLDYAKKFKGKGRVVLDFSKGKSNAKIIVYKYGTGSGGLDSIEERTDSKLDKRRSSVEQLQMLKNSTENTNKKTVIRMFFTFI